MYDSNGDPFGLKYNNTEYYYVKNAQNDVTAITDSAGKVIANYYYDAWGKLLSVTDANGKAITASTNVAIINPIRYRSYYYDTETGYYYLSSRYYSPDMCRFLNADSLVSQDSVLGNNMFAYCLNNPTTGYDPDGTWDWGNFFKGSGWIATGIAAIAVGVSVITCGVAAPVMIAVAGATAIAGAATVVNGVSEICEAATGHNFMRDDVFRGNSMAYNAYAYSTATISQIGTAICGGWMAKNAPRIEAYNNVQNYKYADGAAKHTVERSYYNSSLLQKQIIKYGSMTNEGNGVYTFRAAGSSFNVAKNSFHIGIWELTTINARKLIGHFLLRR